MKGITLVSLFDVVEKIDVSQIDRFLADFKEWHRMCRESLIDKGEVYSSMGWVDDGHVGHVTMYAIGEDNGGGGMGM